MRFGYIAPSWRLIAAADVLISYEIALSPGIPSAPLTRPNN
jgi:hypothetical protein